MAEPDSALGYGIGGINDSGWGGYGPGNGGEVVGTGAQNMWGGMAINLGVPGSLNSPPRDQNDINMLNQQHPPGTTGPGWMNYAGLMASALTGSPLGLLYGGYKMYDAVQKQRENDALYPGAGPSINASANPAMSTTPQTANPFQSGEGGYNPYEVLAPQTPAASSTPTATTSAGPGVNDFNSYVWQTLRGMKA